MIRPVQRCIESGQYRIALQIGDDTTVICKNLGYGIKQIVQDGDDFLRFTAF